jgi:DNA-binding CsgD family transcriptional regulator
VGALLVDRESEAEILSGLLAGAREGRSAVLVLRGEPGIGKSALLDLAVGLAPGFLVLRARGVEAESEIAYAGLQELVWPIVELLGGLRERQRAVLEGALALGPPVGGDPLAVRAATLSLLAAAAQDAPLLVVVDDAHWLDPPSAEALAFAARRLDMEGIVALFAIRETEPSAFDRTGLRELRIGGLDEQPATTLLAQHATRAIAPAVVQQLVSVAGGNPLALLEVPGALSDGQLEGREPLDEPLPVGHGAERAFAQRLERLPPDARDALVLVAADEQDGGVALASALRARGLSESFAPAERAGLIAIIDGRIRFTHPLVRSVVYHSAVGEQRRTAHAALAAAYGESSDRRAWHRAAAATGPDETIAAALEDAAARAAARGGLTTAARTFERAAGLTPASDTRAERLLAAATLAHATGRFAWASDLALAGERLANTPAVHADFQHLAAAVERETGSVLNARTLLWESASAIADHDPTRATLMLVDATVVDTMSGDLLAAAASAQRALEQASSCSRAIEQMAAVAANMVANYRGLLPADHVHIDAFRRTVASLPQLPATAAVTIEILWASWYAKQLEARHAREKSKLDHAIASARKRGALGILPYLLGMGAQLDIREGRWTRASALASEAIELAHETRQPGYRAWGLVNAAMIEAAQGLEGDCRAHATQALELAQASDIGSLAVYVSSVLGLLELGVGNIPRAIEHLEQCAQRAEACGLTHPNVVRYEPDLIEALHAAGDDAQALAAAIRLGQRADRVQSAWGLATAARCRGLLTSEDEFEKEFQAALVLHDHVPGGFERARTQLCYGKRLRRGRRNSDAREQLTQALATFEHLAADPWAEHARRELQAIGISTRTPREHPTIETLTPQELRVALIIADGATIQEAATQLVLSPKTIEAHLGRTYRKLRVRNRAQLATTIARDEATAA